MNHSMLTRLVTPCVAAGAIIGSALIASAGEPCPGFVAGETRPETDPPAVQWEDGWLVPYEETIPGTDVTFRMVPVPGGTFQRQRKGRAETSSSPENNSGNTGKQRKTAGEQHRSTLESTIHRPLQPAQAAQTAGSTAATPGRTSPAPWSPAPWSETHPAKQIVARLLPRLPRLPHQIGVELGYPFGGHSHAGLFQKVGQQPKSTLGQN
jgi:hypothetical protein